MRLVMAQKKFNKTVRLILNILFTFVVIAGIVMGWNKEIDDPDAWFPNEVKSEPAAPAAEQPTQPVEKK